MLPPNVDLTLEISKRYIQERLKEAEILRQLRQAGIIQDSSVSGLGLRLLASLGHKLVALGHRLEQFEIRSSRQRTYNSCVKEHNEFEIT